MNVQENGSDQNGRFAVFLRLERARRRHLPAAGSRGNVAVQRQAVRGALPRGLGALVELYHVVRRGHSEQNLRHRDRGGDELCRAVLVE